MTAGSGRIAAVTLTAEVALCGQRSVTLSLALLVTQMLAPSKATPMGCTPTSNGLADGARQLEASRLPVVAEHDPTGIDGVPVDREGLAGVG